MIRRLIPLVLAVVCLSAGINPRGNTKGNDGTFTRVVLFGDTHWGVPVGGLENGVTRLKSVVEWSNNNAVNAWIVCGDWASMVGDTTVALARRDSVVSFLTDSLEAVVYPVVGNHEWTVADSSTGDLYDNFTARFPAFYRDFETTTNRGFRWYGRRIGNSNVLLFSFQNNRNNPGNDYDANQNADGLDANDFDGISDSTSTQRLDLKSFIDNNVQWGDWVIAAQHRALHGIGSIPARPDQEGGHVDADSSQLVWLDDNLTANYIVLEADVHENKFIDKHGSTKHYTFSICNEARDIDLTRLGNWPTIQMFAMEDTSWSGLTELPGGSVLVDSLGVDSELIANTEWGLFWAIDFEGRKATCRLLLVQSDPLQQAFGLAIVMDVVTLYQDH